jgi:cyclic beta-1,2-glucan synthetase
MGVMVTNAGGGYSKWGDFELTRWRADTTCDSWGSFCYLRDVDNGRVWTNTYQPFGVEPDDYSVNMAIDRVEFHRRDNGIDTETEIVVSPEDDVEIRRMTFINRSNRARRIEITSYIELSMAPHNADRQHPAFNKMFIQTEALPRVNALLSFRRKRDPDDPPIFVAHRLTIENEESSTLQFETDRKRFIGRGRSTANPKAMESDLRNSIGYVLDPILSMRKVVTIRPRQRLSVSMVLAAAETRDQVVRLMEKYGDPRAITRSLELAWVHAQLELRLLRIQPDDARRFQQLASAMLYPDAWLRPPPERLEQNRLGQSGLWPYGISGDLPIAVVSIGEARDLSTVRQMLQAHTFWRQHGLKTDLVILNEESSSYEQPLNERLVRLIETNSIYTDVDQPGGVYLRSVDQIPEEHLTLILSAARVVLVAARGPLSQQLAVSRDAPDLPVELEPRKIPEEPSAPLPFMELPYFNGLGGFTPDGREYAIYLGPEDHTPAPWVNVMANPDFGALVSESGSGFVWYGNSQQNRLTYWSNDAVCDPVSDAFYIRDEESGTFWSPTPHPIRELDAYRTRHGAGYSVFEHNSHAIEQELITFVPMNDDGGEPVRIQRLRLRNDSRQTRRLSITFYAQWVLGEVREENQMHVVTKWDEDAKALLAYNHYHADFGERVAFVAMNPAADDYTADRAVFVGRNQSLTDPAAMHRKNLSQRVGAGLDPCAAIRTSIELGPGEHEDLIVMLGSAASREDAARIIRHYREEIRVEEALQQTSGWWDRLLGRMEIDHPELSVQFLLNRWLIYQTLSCRLWARTAFYQSGGAFGFRDQLQDVMALLYAAPQLAREHILVAAKRQFREGDVQHWWHPPGGAGVRTRISDDLIWLPYVVSQYIKVTGDTDILAEELPFLEGRALQDDEYEIFLVPEESMERESLYEHCRRAIIHGATSGSHGLPLIGTGDWNDGLNRVGAEGKGESVWLAWFLIDVLNDFAGLAEDTGRQDDAADFRQRARRLTERVEKEAWDGAWYKRATFDDGSPLGSARNVEARIDSLPQSWAWISGAAEPDHAKTALESAWEQLVREQDGLVLLFTPPFDKSALDPGYIKGYPPGVRENGGQYTHGAVWLAIAYARMGDGERAAQLLRMLNPIEHTHEPRDVERYAVEPYVVAADVYNMTGNVGHGGWTWYTGSAGWMYRAWIEEVLGLKVRGDELRVDPVIPAAWDGFSIRYSFRDAVYELKVENPDHVSRGIAWIEMDGRRLEHAAFPLEGSAVKHKVVVRMGKRKT